MSVKFSVENVIIFGVHRPAPPLALRGLQGQCYSLSGYIPGIIIINISFSVCQTKRYGSRLSRNIEMLFIRQ